MSEAEMRAAVERGAQLLDEKKPGWWEKITSRLSMADCRFCILGQVYGVYESGIEELEKQKKEFEYKWPAAHGFTATLWDCAHDRWQTLGSLWLEQIERRKQCKAK